MLFLYLFAYNMLIYYTRKNKNTAPYQFIDWSHENNQVRVSNTFLKATTNSLQLSSNQTFIYTFNHRILKGDISIRLYIRLIPTSGAELFFNLLGKMSIFIPTHPHNTIVGIGSTIIISHYYLLIEYIIQRDKRWIVIRHCHVIPLRLYLITDLPLIRTSCSLIK